MPQPDLIVFRAIQIEINAPKRPIDRQIITAGPVGNKAGLKAAVGEEVDNFFVSVAADAVGPAGKLREELAHFKAIVQFVDNGVAEGRDGGGKANFIAVAARPAGVPCLDLGDFDVAEDGRVVVGGITEENAIVSGHFPADIPAILLVAAVCEGGSL